MINKITWEFSLKLKEEVIYEIYREPFFHFLSQPFKFKSPSGKLINESMEHLLIAQIKTKLQPFLN